MVLLRIVFLERARIRRRHSLHSRKGSYMGYSMSIVGIIKGHTRRTMAHMVCPTGASIGAFMIAAAPHTYCNPSASHKKQESLVMTRVVEGGIS